MGSEAPVCGKIHERPFANTFAEVQHQRKPGLLETSKFDISFNWFKPLTGNIRKISAYSYDNIPDTIHAVHSTEKRVHSARNLGYSTLLALKLECGGDQVQQP